MSSAGLGYGGFSIVGERLYTMGAEDGREFVICINTEDGSEIWKTPFADTYENNWGDGPRATPTVDGDHVYVLSAGGTIACLTAADGRVVWTATMQDFGGDIPGWGYCESVLVNGDHVVCTPGGSQGAIVALDKSSGHKAWQTTDYTDEAQYSSIVLATIHGQPQYVQLTLHGVVGVNPADGSVLWTTDFPGRTAVIPTPIVHENHVYVCAGYGAGSKLVEIDSDNNATEVYHNRVMKNHHGGVILLDGHTYGYSDNVGWVCQNYLTGEEVWSDKRSFKKGAIAYADGRFYCLEEDSGQVVLIAASTDGWIEHGRLQLAPLSERRKPDGKIWVHPVIANGKLYLRDQEIISCYDVRASARPKP